MLRNPVISSKKKEPFLLTVYIKRAFGLKNMEVLNLSDAFVKLEFRGQTFETPIVKNNLEPWWDQSFQFVIELTLGE
jgi:Ca2+-dependent lipid-binding protein